MGTIRKPARWLLLLTALAMLAAACAGGGDAEEPVEGAAGEATEGGTEAATEGGTEGGTEAAGEPQEGGSVVFGADQEPPALNGMVLASGNTFAGTLITRPLLLGMYEVKPDFTYAPLLSDGEAEITEDPFTVTYKIRDEATWSDGEPISADDLIFTWETIMDEDNEIISRNGYELITEAEKVDDKTVTFTFSEPFAPWKGLFSISEFVLPAHELEGEDFNTVWNDEITLSSGPFEFDSWQKGQQATIKRNENFWGEPAPLDEIIFRFIEDSNTQVQALQGGEIDMIYPQPQVDLVEQVQGLEGVESDVNAGTVWEHIDFNFTHPLLSQKYVREAIMRGIDRQLMAEQLIAPMNPEAEVLNSLIYVNNQEQYQPHFDRYEYDPEAAIALLEDNGCTRGDDDIFECDGERMSFRYGTTAGNELRELQMQVVQQQLQEIGVEIQPDAQDATVYFGDVLPAGADGAWDLANFAWVGSPDPFGGNSSWECESENNYGSYCNEQVDKLLAQTNTETDPEARVELYYQADELMAEDIPVVPLYQKPTLFAWDGSIVGPRDNPTQQGPTDNAGEWYLTE